jgi:hypothetical protein
MAASVNSGSPGGTFWTLVGIGILVVLLAAGWRVATGAQLEAKGKEWTLKVTETADAIDEAKKQLAAEAQRLKEEAAKRESYWSAQMAAAKESCPKATLPSSAAPPADSASAVAATENALAEVAKKTNEVRVLANDIAIFRWPGLLNR